jgi:hypothetical protein
MHTEIVNTVSIKLTNHGRKGPDKIGPDRRDRLEQPSAFTGFDSRRHSRLLRIRFIFSLARFP